MDNMSCMVQDMDDVTCLTAGERVVSIEAAEKLASQLGMRYFETSSKDNICVEPVFDHLIHQICCGLAKTRWGNCHLLPQTFEDAKLT